MALGVSRAGFTHLAAFDFDHWACETLRGTRLIPTVTETDLSKWTVARWKKWHRGKEEIALLSGGPPCVSFSAAGKNLGQWDKRDCFPHFIRAVKGLKPRAFLIENVKGLVSSRHKKYFDKVIRSLERLGYSVDWKVVNAANTGVPQQRHRVLIVGFASAGAAKRFKWPEPTHSEESLVYAKWISRTYWSEFPTIPPSVFGIRTEMVGAVTRPLDESSPGVHLAAGNNPGPSARELRILRKIEAREPETLEKLELSRWRTVRDAIGDLATVPHSGNQYTAPLGSRRVKGKGIGDGEVVLAQTHGGGQVTSFRSTDEVSFALRQHGSGSGPGLISSVACRRGRIQGQQIEPRSADEVAVALRGSAGGSSQPFLTWRKQNGSGGERIVMPDNCSPTIEASVEQKPAAYQVAELPKPKLAIGGGPLRSHIPANHNPTDAIPVSPKSVTKAHPASTADHPGMTVGAGTETRNVLDTASLVLTPSETRRIRERREPGLQPTPSGPVAEGRMEFPDSPERPSRTVPTVHGSTRDTLVFCQRALTEPPAPAYFRGVIAQKHPPAEQDNPAHAVVADHNSGVVNIVRNDPQKHPSNSPDAPSCTVRSGGSGHDASPVYVDGITKPVITQPLQAADAPSPTVSAGGTATGGAEPIAHGRLMIRNQVAGDGDGATPDDPSVTVVVERGTSLYDAEEQREYRDANGRLHKRADGLLRRLSPRECARLQDFPDSWEFQGTKTAIYRMIGNAAPPGMIEPVARAIHEALRT